MRLAIHVVLGLGVVLCGCSIEVPIDPGGLVTAAGEIIDDLSDTVTDVLVDPLSSQPYPTIIGGNAEQLYYATDVGDFTFEFPGVTNDLVLPGIVGPTNIYEFSNAQKALVRALVPGGTYFGMVTDGQYLAYISISKFRDPDYTVVTATLDAANDKVIFLGDDERQLRIEPGLHLENGRLVYAIVDSLTQTEAIRVEDLLGLESALELYSYRIERIALRGNLLAYIEEDSEGDVRLMLRDLGSESLLTVSESIRSDLGDVYGLVISDNQVVWSEPRTDGLTRIYAYDIPTGTTYTWVDAALGRLSGATDDYFVTKEFVTLLPDETNRIKVYRYDVLGQQLQLADFPADGLAGHVRVLGDRVAWVNDEGEIVLAPVQGGDRTIVQPY